MTITVSEPEAERSAESSVSRSARYAVSSAWIVATQPAVRPPRQAAIIGPVTSLPPMCSVMTSTSLRGLRSLLRSAGLRGSRGSAHRQDGAHDQERE
jgi:hypothetical protein